MTEFTDKFTPELSKIIPKATLTSSVTKTIPDVKPAYSATCGTS